MKIRLKIDDKVITATLNDSKTARDFVSQLPLTLTKDDLFRREKFARLPRAISEEGKRTHTYEVGQVVYWSPGPDVAIFYRNDGEKIPNPGIIVIGKIDSGSVKSRLSCTMSNNNQETVVVITGAEQCLIIQPVVTFTR